MAEEKPLRVRVAFTVELDSEAMEQWSMAYGVTGRRAIAEDVRRYFANAPLTQAAEQIGVKVVR